MQLAALNIIHVFLLLQNIVMFSFLLKKKYPRNYLIENPGAGAVIIALFTFLFVILYKPLDTTASQSLSFVATIAIYSVGTGLSVIIFEWLLGRIRWFSDVKDWTLVREACSVLLVLCGVGTVIWLMGFFVEAPADRLNLSTYFDSVSRAFLLGLLPFLFFSALNYRYLLDPDDAGKTAGKLSQQEKTEKGPLVIINSRLKKEELSFFPDQFIYAESDGNYVVFCLIKDNVIKKETIRNSITNVEEQLKAFPDLLRTHRAFIVNLKKITGKKGNILGYQLTLSDTGSLIPVSRNNIPKFDEAFSKLN